jgi:hypothetical protein
LERWLDRAITAVSVSDVLGWPTPACHRRRRTRRAKWSTRGTARGGPCLSRRRALCKRRARGGSHESAGRGRSGALDHEAAARWFSV